MLEGNGNFKKSTIMKIFPLYIIFLVLVSCTELSKQPSCNHLKGNWYFCDSEGGYNSYTELHINDSIIEYFVDKGSWLTYTYFVKIDTLVLLSHEAPDNVPVKVYMSFKNNDKLSLKFLVDTLLNYKLIEVSKISDNDTQARDLLHKKDSVGYNKFVKEFIERKALYNCKGGDSIDSTKIIKIPDEF